MKMRVERAVLAQAVAWAAKHLPVRPPVPVLAGVLLELGDGTLSVSGFDYEVSSQMTVDALVDTPGRGLVSGRLLAEITRALPDRPVQLSGAGAQVEVTCGTARFTLPTMPVEEYPTLPAMPGTVGAVDADEFAVAVGQVAVAAGRNDTLPMLSGVQVELDAEKLTLLATDRYRIAARELAWRPSGPGVRRRALVPAKTLADTAKATASDKEVTIALDDGDGLIGLAGSGRRSTARLIEGDLPMGQIRSHLEAQPAAQARLPRAALVEVVRRVALVAERNTPVRLSFDGGLLTVDAGSDDDARASESMGVEFAAEEPLSIAFNPQFLLDGLTALHAETAVISLTTPARPAILTGEDADGVAATGGAYRYVLMPLRLSA